MRAYGAMLLCFLLLCAVSMAFSMDESIAKPAVQKQKEDLILQYSAMALSSDGKWLVLGTKDAAISCWDLASGKQTRFIDDLPKYVRFEIPESQRISGRLFMMAPNKVHSLGLSGDGKLQAATTALDEERLHLTGAIPDGNVWLWEAFDNKTKAAKISAGRTVLITANGSRLISVGETSARLLSLPSGRLIRTFAETSGSICCTALSKDEKWLFTNTSSGVAHLWELETGFKKAILPKAGTSFLCACLSFNGSLLATGDAKGVVKIWDIASGKQVSAIEGKESPILSVDFRSDQNALAFLDAKQTFWLVELKDQAKTWSFSGAVAFAISNDSKPVFIAKADGSIGVFDRAKKTEVATLISFRNGEWIVFDSRGRFDSSNRGQIEHLMRQIEDGNFVFGKLRDRIFEPGLLSKYLG